MALDFHDGHIIGLYIETDKSLKLNLKLADQLVEVSFHNYSGFRATDFRPQNVVSRVIVYPTFHESLKDLLKRIRWINTFEGDCVMSEDNISRIAKNVMNKELVLIYFEPSVGMELGIYCKSYNSRILYS